MSLRLQSILLHIQVPGMPHWEEVDTKHWKDYTFLLAWKCLNIPLDELEEEETREKKNWASLHRLVHPVSRPG